MDKADVIIIVAGAAGLMAAYTLAKAGRRAIVLEARNRLGGRIHTLKDKSFFSHAELGAEFVHGNLPVTMHLLQKSGIKFVPSDGEMWQHHNGKLSKSEWIMDNWGELMEKLNGLKTDTSIGNFLAQNFAEEKYDQLRKSVTRFVSGYDTADPFKASVFALREEWQSEDEDAQHRVAGGYGLLVNYLETESRKAGAEFCLNSIVKKISWENDMVEVATKDGSVYSSDKIIIALPLGVLKAGPNEQAAIVFDPPIPEYSTAVGQMGFGSIIKLLLAFKNTFWENEETEHLGFVLSDEEIPTWWTQYPNHSNVLTGWLGGLPAECKKDMRDEELLNLGIQSLANIFGKNADDLKHDLLTWKVVNWTVDPFTLGSYAYDTVESHAARQVLSEPVGNMIWFAGEYLYEGPAMGTVEAALSSGLETAKKIL